MENQQITFKSEMLRGVDQVSCAFESRCTVESFGIATDRAVSFPNAPQLRAV